MANEIHTLNVGNTSYTIQPRVLGPMSTHNTNGAQFSASSVVRYDTLLGENPFGPNKSSGYNNAVLSISRYSNDRYTSQLGFSGVGIYARWFNDKTPDATTPWRRFIMDDGGETLNIDTPIVNVIGEILNIGSTGTSELHLNAMDDIFIGDSESEINPVLDIAASSINISGGQHTSTDIILGNVIATDEGYAQYVYTYCNIIPRPIGGNTVDIGDINRRFNTGYFKNVNYTGTCAQNSDERLKNFGDNLKIDFDALAQMRKANYTWKDTESYGEGNNIGVSAQEVQKLYPEIVVEDTDTKLLSVDYAKLSVVALAAIDELHKENVELKSRLDKLEELITKLTK